MVSSDLPILTIVNDSSSDGPKACASALADASNAGEDSVIKEGSELFSVDSVEMEDNVVEKGNGSVVATCSVKGPWVVGTSSVSSSEGMGRAIERGMSRMATKRGQRRSGPILAVSSSHGRVVLRGEEMCQTYIQMKCRRRKQGLWQISVSQTLLISTPTSDKINRALINVFSEIATFSTL